MRILGIDTATSAASVTLVDNEEIIADERYPQSSSEGVRDPNQPKSGHAVTILPLIESVLRGARNSLADLDGIAVSIGPGSFTGLRIGLSTVKGLAYGRGCPVVGVSTLNANAVRVTDFEGVICSVLDARRNQVYASFYRRVSESLSRLTEDTVAPIFAVIDKARELGAGASCLFIGDGAKAYKTELTGSFGSDIRLCAGDCFPSLASGVARLGERRLRSSGGDLLGSLVPVYLRLSQAETKCKQSANYLKNRAEPTLTKMGS